ncbi:MAG TPA: hydrophobe/amphiphile efflux-1 family RND transporter [Lentisphaeria bacterium]|nr:MAG: RND transporter [Lentisphaerae bacterium GWF2_38_69]HBM15368.1 hydrophobe/amphiphile efflux-1 family RND transporter [Lentisphaeria bacterium]
MFSHFFIERPKFAFVVSILIVLAGLIAIAMLPVAQYPEITPPVVNVSTHYPGADASTVEQTVVIPLEEQINGVENMLYMSSTSSNDGSASIDVTFNIGTDHDINTVNTQNRVAQALSSLPDTVTKQGVTVKAKSTDMLAIIDIYSPDEKHDGIFLSNYASLNIRDEMMRVPGVGDATLLGGQDYSMRIWLDPDKLTSLNLTVGDVLKAIEEQNIQVAAGVVGSEPSASNQKLQYTIRAKGRLSNVEEFKNMILREDSDGSIVKVKDVARVELGSYSYNAFGELNKKPCALLAIYQLPGSNALEVVDHVYKKLDTLSKQFPKGIAVNILYDSTTYVRLSIKEVIKTLIIAVCLVIFVTFLFLQNWKAALIPTLAVPVSLIGTFAVLMAFGYSINTVTLFGLILAIGIVVDDAIVVIENVHRIMSEEGLSAKEATKKSMLQVTSPVVATTLVLMAMFLPVTFLPGITGELYRQFGITVAVAVGISAINALTLSPALCATLLTNEHSTKSKFFIWFNRIFDSIKRYYNCIVSFTLARPKTIIIFMLLLFCSIYFMYTNTPTGFLPAEDHGVIMLNVQLPDNASLKRTSSVVHKITDILLKIKEIQDVQAVNGYSMLSNSCGSNNAMIIAMLKPWDQRKLKEQSSDAITQNINRTIAEEVPGASVFAFVLPPISGLGTTGGFELVLQDTTGNHPKRLYEVVNSVVNSAMQTPIVAFAYSMYRASVPQIYLDIDREKVKKLGLGLSDVFTTLQAYLGSIYVNDFNKFGKTYKVYVQAMAQYRKNKDDIGNLYVRNENGEMIPLRTLVNVKKIFEPEVIYHYNMLPSATINGSAASGYSSGEAIKAMEKIAKDDLPEGMIYSWTGTAYQEILAGNIVILIFILAIIFIYLFLVAQYESWTLALAVMLSVPIGFIGALIAITIARIDNNIYAQIGFVLVFGLAAKTAILIVEFAKKERESGSSIMEAATKAANLRFRAVIMTISAFLLGVLPLVIASGAGAASRQSLGTAVFGGALATGVIGTILIPSFYAIIQKTKEAKKKKRENKNLQITR